MRDHAARNPDAPRVSPPTTPLPALAVAPESVEDSLRIGAPAESAAGIGGVAVALTVTINQMGVARAAESLRTVNQQQGFDCPGCAWPEDGDQRSIAEFCENGAKAIAEEATTQRVAPEFFAQHSVEALTQQSDYWLSQQGRLTHPMCLRRGATHYQPIAWAEAFAIIATELRGMHSPHEAVFYTSGRTSNEAAFLYQLFVRMLGTNNLPDCSNLCHESSGVAMRSAIGSGKGTVTLKDFAIADCIVVIGQNPGTNHPRMLKTLQEASRRGCRIISINPLMEAGLKRFKNPQELMALLGVGTALATLHVPVLINGDLALLKGVQKAMLQEHAERLDREFIRDHTSGFEAFRQDIEHESWDSITATSGIAEPQIRELAAILAQSRSMICCWAMGLTQHKNAVATIQSLLNLLLMGGHLGRAGAGACPVRGHSNVQGDRTMGIHERPSEDFLERLEREFQFTPPREPGYSTVEAIEAMHAGRVRVFFAMGGNFLSASPDTNYTASALQACALTVQVSTKLNRSHLVTGQHALILPCLGRTERDEQSSGPQFVSVENSMGVVHSSRGTLAPASAHLLSEPAIVARLAAATLGCDWSGYESNAVDWSGYESNAVDWSGYESNYDSIRARIAKVIPGFTDMNARIREPNGFQLPHAVRDAREFHTNDGRAHFTVHPIAPLEVPQGHFILTTIRTHDQFNTTIYGMDDRYRGIYNARRVVLMNHGDMKLHGLAARDAVDIVSHFRGTARRARNFRVVPYEIPRGCLAAYFPETNVLVPIDSIADGSQTPTSKSLIVSLHRAAKVDA